MPRTAVHAAVLLALTSLTALASAQEADAAGEAAMLAEINGLRAQSQLAPLARLEALDATARAHSAEMARTGQLAHVSEATGTPEDRVRDAGVSALRVTENVASHRDSASAHEAVLASPAHRQNVLDPAVTHVGLGAVRTERGVFVTQLYAGLPAASPAAAAPVEALPPASAPEAVTSEPAPGGPLAGVPGFGLIPPFFESAVEQAAPLTEALQGAPAPAPECRAARRGARPGRARRARSCRSPRRRGPPRRRPPRRRPPRRRPRRSRRPRPARPT
ncbi:MAG: CAP domain-containing protein [Sandaracinaceae bacterium]|nr:CAP domain-containing protein [Sandaracinaceae bacterium]